MTASKIFLYFCLSFTIGVFFNSIIKIPQLLTLGFLIAALVLISVLWKYKNLVILGFCIIFLVLVIWRHQSAEAQISNNKLQIYNDKEQNITLIGIITTEPDIKEKTQTLTMKSEQLTIDTSETNISGKVLISAWKYPEYEYGDKLKITGKLKTPAEDINGFNYRNYLLKDGVYSVMAWPKIELIEKNQGNIIYKYLFSFKNKLKESVNLVMAPPQSGLLEALFFGDEGNISKEWKDKFNLTGTRHITAVSGMNITIISALILNFLLFLGLWRSQAFYISVILLILYILMIGAPASAVRAGIMGCLFLTAQHFGRMSSASRAIVFASTSMLFLNPLLLRLDVGFQLSFLAMMGLVYLQPIFLDFFKKIPNIFQLRYALAATISAQIFTLPILIYNFGRIPITSPLTNILIVPFLSIITILGFIFSFLGMIFHALGLVLSWPAWLLLTYILKVIDLFSKIPFVSITLSNIHWIWLAIFYLILGFMVWRFQKKQTLKFLQY